MAEMKTPKSGLGTVEETHRKMQQAVRKAVLEHKQSGNPIAGWDGEKVLVIPPESIEVPPEND